ncbi:IucA/IucC family siderophore biosynthesis protein [Bacillus tianshenii]|nr:IucA/IucC family siderophore biosynthesis protein [Bacillus tianshenii]
MKHIHNVKDTLTQQRWEKVNQQLLTKMIREFMYEDMLQPTVIEEKNNSNVYQLDLKSGVSYQFEAQPRLMDSFFVDEQSIQRFNQGEWKEAKNAIQFILDIQTTIGMTSETTGHLIKEYNQTLLADLHLDRQKKRADELVGMDYGELEGEMDGHPWITYNKGRIGFNYDDYLSYAPEHKKEVKLQWLAVHQSIATFHSVSAVERKSFIKEEIGGNVYHHFQNELTNAGLETDEYFFMPIHEWQWENVIVQYFPEQLANKLIVPLGEGEDSYLPQQSIRTFVNRNDKNKHHVKLPISILNTLVYRGLPSERTVVAPLITEFIQGIKEQDDFLREECRLILPGEVASMNVDHPYYANLTGAPYQYLEMLGCIWRESIYSFLDEGEEAITLASLLYIDDEEKPFVHSLIEQSGLTIDEWITKLFNVVLPPLLHYFYQYGTVFSPHGQNTVLILKDNKPHRLAMKDFVDDVNISGEPLPELNAVPNELKNVLRSEEPEGLCQFIFTGLFVCHFRYLADILHRHSEYDEAQFWLKLRETIVAYQEQFPNLKDRFELFDLLRPTFTKLCLNRNRMIDYGYEDGDDRPHASEFGCVSNPIAIVAKTEKTSV